MINSLSPQEALSLRLGIAERAAENAALLAFQKRLVDTLVKKEILSWEEFSDIMGGVKADLAGSEKSARRETEEKGDQPAEYLDQYFEKRQAALDKCISAMYETVRFNP